MADTGLPRPGMFATVRNRRGVIVAFHDLEEKIRACGGDRDAGIEAFLGQNEDEGWMLRETLRLADYGLGHDERAKHPQPAASRLGPRFYDWQLAQSAEESWRECYLHARNLLGEQGYRELLGRDRGARARRGAGALGGAAGVAAGRGRAGGAVVRQRVFRQFRGAAT